MCEKNLLSLSALICALPGAILAFRKGFIEDIKKQMLDRENPSGFGTKTIKWYYKLIAIFVFGPKRNLIDLSNANTPKWLEKLEKDKTTSVRIFIWFLLVFIFAFLSWYFYD